MNEIQKLGSKAVALEADLFTGISGVKKLWAAFEKAVRLGNWNCAARYLNQ